MCFSRTGMQALEWGALVTLMHEFYTSKSCSSCFTLHTSLGGSETYNCINPACGKVCDRDDNGVCNNLVKGILEPYGPEVNIFGSDASAYSAAARQAEQEEFDSTLAAFANLITFNSEPDIQEGDPIEGPSDMDSVTSTEDAQ